MLAHKLQTSLSFSAEYLVKMPLRELVFLNGQIVAPDAEPVWITTVTVAVMRMEVELRNARYYSRELDDLQMHATFLLHTKKAPPELCKSGTTLHPYLIHATQYYARVSSKGSARVYIAFNSLLFRTTHSPW